MEPQKLQATLINTTFRMDQLCKRAAACAAHHCMLYPTCYVVSASQRGETYRFELAAA